MTMWIGLLISAVLVVTWGILVAFLPKEEAYYMTLLGIALAFDGAENIWNTMYTVRVRAKSEHAEDRYGSLESKTWAAAKEHLEELNQRIASEKRQKKDGTK